MRVARTKPKLYFPYYLPMRLWGQRLGRPWLLAVVCVLCPGQLLTLACIRKPVFILNDNRQ